MIYWVLINYHNEEDIISLIESIKDPNLIFVIVDNSSTFDFNSLNSREIKILKPDINLGYIGGFQYALHQLNLYENKKIIFSNSDIAIFSPIEFLNLITMCCIIVPSIKNLDDKAQNPHIVFKPKRRYFSILKILSSKDFLWFIFLLFRKLKNIVSPHIKSNFKEISIYAGHGSFIYFNELNLRYFADKKFNFLFAEEIHIAEFAKSYNYPIVYNPLFEVLHREHSTTSSVQFSKKRNYYFDSYNYILNNYYK
jgi:hypothetical protein